MNRDMGLTIRHISFVSPAHTGRRRHEVISDVEQMGNNKIHHKTETVSSMGSDWCTFQFSAVASIETPPMNHHWRKDKKRKEATQKQQKNTRYELPQLRSKRIEKVKHKGYHRKNSTNTVKIGFTEKDIERQKKRIYPYILYIYIHFELEWKMWIMTMTKMNLRRIAD